MKKLMKFVSVLLIVILVLVFTLIRYYSGAKGFERLEGSWEGTIGEKPVKFKIYKGSRAVKGFSYGYLELVNESGETISTHKIRFKDKKVFESGDVSGELIELNLLNEESLLEGEVTLILNESGEILKGGLSAEKEE